MTSGLTIVTLGVIAVAAAAWAFALWETLHQ
jgi:hypothetical protein